MTKSKAIASDFHRAWQLPTNHQNLLFMLSSGLITGPMGFEYGGESKYYKDVLSLCPGWIPLFKGNIPDGMQALSTEEITSLIPTIATINMDDYLGDVYVFTDVNGWGLTPYSDVTDKANLILVPAPLPISWIVAVSFKDKVDLEKFKNTADDFANTDISGLQFLVSNISEDNQISLNSQIDSESTALQEFTKMHEENANITTTEKAQALGGIVAMLYQFANNSDLSVDVFKKLRKIMTPSVINDMDYYFNSEDAIVKGLPYWFDGKPIPGEDLRATFFFGLLEDIINNREGLIRNELTSASREYITTQLKDSIDLQYNWRSLPKLLSELSRPELTLSEQFDKFKGTVSHALLLYFQRESCDELFEFQPQNPNVILSNTDIIAAALLFGARDGWIGLPKEYRQSISEWTTSFMAQKAHCSDKVVIQIYNEAPKPLREYFVGDAWLANEKYALDIARKRKWDECLLTMIRIPKSYCVEEGYLVLHGDVKGSAIKTVVEKEIFLSRLSNVSIEEDQTIRAKSKGLLE